jgi:hypothetical protein
MVGRKKLVRKAEPPSKPTEDRNSQSVSLRPPIGAKKTLWGLRGKTVWDWLPIVGTLLVPVMIAAGTWGITWQQGKLAEQRAQDEALQAYLDQMSQLLMAEDLRNSEEGSAPRTLARARTLTLLGRLDSSRKGRLLRFLYEAKLINKRNPIVELTGADASDADLSRAVLGAADLKGVDLSGADLSRSELVEADLSCSPPTVWWMKRNQSCTDLSGANLSGADLHQTNMSCAPAPEWWMETKRTDCVDLRDANLSGADLTYADLSGANLTGADVTEERLDEQANSLLGARMPNGQQYEEWVADRKGGGEEVTKRAAHEGCERDSAVVNAPSDFRQKALNACVKSILD